MCKEDSVFNIPKLFYKLNFTSTDKKITVHKLFLTLMRSVGLPGRIVTLINACPNAWFAPVTFTLN